MEATTAESSKLNSKIALLKRVSYFLKPEMKQMFYNAYILPVFDYCCNVWGKGSGVEHTIFKYQKRIARIILNKPSISHQPVTICDLKWLTFKQRYEYHVALLVHKAKHNLAPQYITGLLKFSSNTMYSLRSETREDLQSVKVNTNYLKCSFSYNSRMIWNKIPIHIRSISNLETFKYHLKKHLLTE